MAVFVAFQVPPEIAQGCLAIQRGLADGTDATPVHMDDFHLTLAYLGARDADEVALIARAIDESVAALSSDEIALDGPIDYREVHGHSMVVFRDNGAGQAMWDDLNERLGDAIGYRRQFDSWLPHVSILRHQRPPGLAPELEPMPAFTPVGPRLFESAPAGSARHYRLVGAYE
jgi:2'-5' RNA ligase